MVKAAWNIFGESYAYRAKYNAYKKARLAEDRKAAKWGRQISLFDGGGIPL